MPIIVASALTLHDLLVPALKHQPEISFDPYLKLAQSFFFFWQASQVFGHWSVNDESPLGQASASGANSHGWGERLGTGFSDQQWD